MHDSNGDGWQGATWSVYTSTTNAESLEGTLVTSGTLGSGAFGVAWMCLTDDCYELLVTGGSSGRYDQISFEIIDEIGGTFSGLTAPYDGHFCTSWGDVLDHPTFSPTASSLPGVAPTLTPHGLPTSLPLPTSTVPVCDNGELLNQTSGSCVAVCGSSDDTERRRQLAVNCVRTVSEGCEPPTLAPVPAPTLEPTPTPTQSPTTAVPTPLPTPNPTRQPIIAVSLSISGITCDSFDAVIYDLALDSVIANATFSDPACTDVTSDAVSVSNELSLPLAIAAKWGKSSVHEHVTDVLTAAVSEVRWVRAMCSTFMP